MADGFGSEKNGDGQRQCLANSPRDAPCVSRLEAIRTLPIGPGWLYTRSGDVSVAPNRNAFWRTSRKTGFYLIRFVVSLSVFCCWGAAMGLWAARHSVAGNSGRGFFPAQTGVFQGTRGARTSADLCGRALRADPPSSVCHLAILPSA